MANMQVSATLNMQNSTARNMQPPAMATADIEFTINYRGQIYQWKFPKTAKVYNLVLVITALLNIHLFSQKINVLGERAVYKLSQINEKSLEFLHARYVMLMGSMGTEPNGVMQAFEDARTDTTVAGKLARLKSLAKAISRKKFDQAEMNMVDWWKPTEFPFNKRTFLLDFMNEGCVPNLICIHNGQDHCTNCLLFFLFEWLWFTRRFIDYELTRYWHKGIQGMPQPNPFIARLYEDTRARLEKIDYEKTHGVRFAADSALLREVVALMELLHGGALPDPGYPAGIHRDMHSFYDVRNLLEGDD